MKKDQIIIVYKKIDSGIRKNKEEYMKYAKLKGYLYFSECIHSEYLTRSAMSIIKEMEDNDIMPIGINYLRNIKNKVDIFLAGRALPIYEKSIAPTTYGKVPQIKKDGYCYNCRTEKVKRKIAPGNHALCLICDKASKGSYGGNESYGSNRCSF